jgi:hypothetical protein
MAEEEAEDEEVGVGVENVTDVGEGGRRRRSGRQRKGMLECRCRCTECEVLRWRSSVRGSRLELRQDFLRFFFFSFFFFLKVA